jgi:glucose-6-phosphate 1-dehydrogenase
MNNAHDTVTSRVGRGHRGPPCAMVIFGANGDLTKRLLMPGLYNLAKARRLSEKFAVIGIDRSEWSHENFRANLAEGVRSFVSDTATGSVAEEFDADSWDVIASRMSHIDGDATNPELYSRLAEALKKIEADHGTGGNVIFYLAVANSLFGTIVERLAEAGLTEEKDGHWRRVIIEKPFGTDLASAHALDARLLKVLAESQIYRMDHFLGK